MQHCKKLKAFCGPADGTAISEASVMAVASRLDDLRHLWLYECLFESDEQVLALAEHCSNLTTLSLHAPGSAVSQEALVTLVSNLRSVVELTLDKIDLSDSVLAAIAAHCPQLKVFDLCESQGYTEVGIAALACGCTSLKKVCSRQDDEVLTPAARLLWQVLRPGLEWSGRRIIQVGCIVAPYTGKRFLSSLCADRLGRSDSPRGQLQHRSSAAVAFPLVRSFQS
jgi:hypothetical protein